MRLQYFNAFASGMHARDDPYRWVSCPVEKCRFEAPRELLDVAMERHRSQHSTQDWLQVVEWLQGCERMEREHYEHMAETIAGDISHVRRWAGSVT